MSPQEQDEAPDLTISDAVDLYIRRKQADWKGETERTYHRNLEDFELYAAEAEIKSLEELTRWNIEDSPTICWIRTTPA